MLTFGFRATAFALPRSRMVDTRSSSVSVGT